MEKKVAWDPCRRNTSGPMIDRSFAPDVELTFGRSQSACARVPTVYLMAKNFWSSFSSMAN